MFSLSLNEFKARLRVPRADARRTMAEYAPQGAILVTGGAGFIGSHVVDRLARAWPAARIVVLDRMDYCASELNLEAVMRETEGRVRLVRGDVSSLDLVSHLLASQGVDTVLHFAAQTHVDSSFGNSLAFTRDNTLGTHCLLEAARTARSPRVRRFVFVSTDEVYGESSVGAAQGLRECARLEPTNPYSAAKAAAEMMCGAYATSYRMPIIITRGNNVYGPRQFPEKLVPKMALLALRGAPLPIHGAGDAVRSYLYVGDVAEAFEVILRRGADGETYNIGSDTERSVLDVVRDVRGVVAAQDHAPIVHVDDRAFNDRRYFIGSAKLHALGWAERTPWHEGLRATADWYASIDPATFWSVGAVEGALRGGQDAPCTR